MFIRITAVALVHAIIWATLSASLRAQDSQIPSIPAIGDAPPTPPTVTPSVAAPTEVTSPDSSVSALSATISPATTSPKTTTGPSAGGSAKATSAIPQKIPFLRPHFLVPESKETIKKLLGYFEELPRLAEQAASGKGNGKQMALGRARGNQINRELERLRVFGEPLVVDMQYRASFYGHPIGTALEAYLATPKGRADREKAKAYVARTAPARGKIIKQLEGLIAKGQFVQAEALLDKTYDDLYPYMAYIHHYDHKVVYDPFLEVSGAISRAMTAKRRDATRVAFQAVISDASAQRDALLAMLEQSRLEMPKGGTITIDGETLPGPAAANMVIGKWEQVHAAFLRAQAVEIVGQVTGIGASPQYINNVAFWANESVQLTSTVQKAIVDWINVDAQMASVPAAKQNYIAYIQTIAGVSRRISNDSWQSGFETALAGLASRAELSNAVRAYDKSTAELMKWRAKVTSAMVQREIANFPDLYATSENALPYEPPSVGFYRIIANRQRPSIPCLYDAIPKSFPWALSVMQNRPVSISESFYRLGDTKILMSRYRQGYFAKSTAVPEPLDAIGRLKNDLLVDADHPPLNLKAACAIASAERGEFRKVGGVVVNMGLEGSISRFAVIPPDEATLVALNQIQMRVDVGDELSGLLIRYDIQPQWLAHDYFLFKVAANP